MTVAGAVARRLPGTENERLATGEVELRATDLTILSEAKTIAVVGASRTPGTIGHQILSNLITEGFTGAVYPVNARARAVTP